MTPTTPPSLVKISLYSNDFFLIIIFLLQAWPEDALEMVANKFLEEVDMAHGVRKECVFMCKYFHESVRELSDRSVRSQLISLFQTERRCGFLIAHNYLNVNYAHWWHVKTASRSFNPKFLFGKT